MMIGKKELHDLRDELERLTNFIKLMEGRELPYFYRYFDAMKNNIEIFLRVGEEDVSDLIPLLERDWRASHTIFFGVQEYNPKESNPEADQGICLYFAQLIAKVGQYFEYGEKSCTGASNCTCGKGKFVIR